MTIGVAIVSYHYGHLVAQAISSVLGQTRKADQIVVIDDASNDMTCQVAKMYNLPCICRPKNLGTQDNFRDILLNVFTTDLCMYLGADNWLHPQYLELTEQKIKDNVKVVGTDCFIVGEYGQEVAKLDEVRDWYTEKYGYPVWHYPKGDIFDHNYIHGSALCERKALLDVNGYEGDCHIDNDLWKRIAQRGYDLDKIDEPLLYYRKHRFNFNRKQLTEIGANK
jgi:glycosyltransferase involved in cell wall biosynthesis